MPREQLFSSESVTEGHPDKLADQISDAVLDAHLAQDANARVACEVLLKTKLLVVAGEVRSQARIDPMPIARQVLADVGYDEASLGFSLADTLCIDRLEAQSPDIAQGVDASGSHEQGAGDQGMMFGYATDETATLMPAPIAWAHAFAQRLAEARKSGAAPGLRPDGKVQVTVRYRDDRPVAIDTLLISAQHDDGLSEARVQEMLQDAVVAPALKQLAADGTHGAALPVHRLLVNPTGRFVIGGPEGDAGLTGRKIIVDTYGGMGRHGGGAFSGKDPSKVDRSAAYYARFLAKQVVAAGLARRCEVQLAYAIGRAEPVSLRVDTQGTSRCDEADIEAAVADCFDARPAALVAQLDLLRPRYRALAAYGHFGRDPRLASWEATDSVEALRASLPAAAKLPPGLGARGPARDAGHARPS
jgi:S-adenosylmethionine synthetase